MTQAILWWCSLAGLGLGVGLIAGMFGVGGGFLLTPLLVVIFRVPLPIAIGTGLCQISGVATAALIRHRRLGQGEVKIDWLMMAGSLVGVGLGTQTVTALSAMRRISFAGHDIAAARLVLSGGYVLLLGGASVWMWRQARSRVAARPLGWLARLRWLPLTTLPRTKLRVSVPLLSYLGLGMGFLSGLLGIGGGVALMPVLIYGFGLPIRVAAGTGILALLVTSLMGTVAYTRSGDVDLPMALTLLAGSTLGAQVGATWTSRLPESRLHSLFAGVSALTACAVAWDLGRTWLLGN